jgi:outer membrane lipoprotein-sorting protein
MTDRHDPELELDRMIDALNAERRPETPSSPDLDGLLRTVRSVKALKEPVEPSPGFEERLLASVRPRRRRPAARWWMALTAAAAAILLVFLVPGLLQRDVAVAMARAVARVQSYHGTAEVRMITAAGEQQLVRTQEIWVDGSRYAIRNQNGTTTVNDGNRKWQIRHDEKLVAILPVAPDPVRMSLDLKAEGARAQEYPHRSVGQEAVAGRPAVVLEIAPPGGEPYRLWVDTETDLPVRLVTAMQNGIQTTTTFVSLDINQPIAPSVFAYVVPAGYRVEEDDPGQQVTTAGEAAARLGFEPIMPVAEPVRMIAYANRLVMEYADAVVTQRTAPAEAFTPAAHGALGSAAGGPVEVLPSHLRWRQAGLEILVTGKGAEALARQMAPDLQLPSPSATTDGTGPQVKVPVDLVIATNDQKQVDGGHSPWQLDPVQVVWAFMNGRGSRYLSWTRCKW